MKKYIVALSLMLMSNNLISMDEFNNPVTNKFNNLVMRHNLWSSKYATVIQCDNPVTNIVVSNCITAAYAKDGKHKYTALAKGKHPYLLATVGRKNDTTLVQLYDVKELGCKQPSFNPA